MPLIDSSQDYSLLKGYQNETHTVLRFSRLWDTCDKVKAYDTVILQWYWVECYVIHSKCTFRKCTQQLKCKPKDVEN